MTTPQWRPYDGAGEIPAGVIPERLVCYRKHGEALGVTWTEMAKYVPWHKVREWRIFSLIPGGWTHVGDPLPRPEHYSQPLPLRLRNAARDVYAQGAPPTDLEHRVVRLLREAANALEQDQ